MRAVRRTRLVLADDDEPTRVLIATMVGFLGDVEVVGQASDGIEAVDTALACRPDVVLLDVNMPRVDGFTAAELLRSRLPDASILLHTTEPDGEKRRRAEALGLRLLDKRGLEETIERLPEELPYSERVLAPAALEPLVLAALAARTADAALVVDAHGSVPFYTAAAAELLDLPWPAQRLSLEDAWAARRPVHVDGRPRDPEGLPLNRALRERRPVSGELHDLRPDGAVRVYWVSAAPFFGSGGEFLGAAAYLRLVSEPPSQRTNL